MKFRFPFVFSLLVLTGAASAADPQLLKLVMPDAKVVSGIDFDRVKATPFGMFFLSQLPAGDAAFNEMLSATGFDPRRDIHEIVMASPANPQTKSGLLLVRGAFDSQRILSAFKMDGKTAEMYKGVAIVSTGHAPHGVSEALAFLDNATVAAGDVDSVHGAIDRRGTSSVLDAALTAAINRTSVNQDMWVVSTAPISSFAPVIPDRNVKGALEGDLVKAIQQSSGGIRFGNMIEISGELTARTDKDASSLADVVKFFMNMATMQGSGGGGLGHLTAMLQNLTVNADANAVKLFVAIPENDLEALIKMAGGRVTHGPRI
jgi:hypothetical protein